jgi:small subunit ribosomal protein S21
MRVNIGVPPGFHTPFQRFCPVIPTPPPNCPRSVSGAPSHAWKEAIEVQVLVRENNVDQALRVLKKKMQREGIFREMKLRRNYEKPSERRARERAEAIRRTRKLMRKRMEREGY